MTALKVALRTLTKTPFVTAVAILSLALGIGANAAIFSLFDQLLMQSLPVRDPGGLVNFLNPGPKPGSQSCGGAGGCDEVFSYPMFKDLEAAESGFSGIAAHVAFGANLAQDGETVHGAGMLVSGSYFGVLGVRPALGRLLTTADDQNIGEHFVAVLSHDYWRNRLGSDPGVLNGTIIVNGKSMTIVGVAAEGFRGTTFGAQPDVFLPLTMRDAMFPTWWGFEERRGYWAYLFGRLEPGVSIERASAEINNVYSAIVNDVEADVQQGMSDATMEQFRAKELVFEPGYRGQSNFHDEAQTPLMLLLGITGTVLLIACANIANLLLARGAKRDQEIAIRGSIGASRWQLLRQLLLESSLLAALGGVASLLVAQWTLAAIGAVVPDGGLDSLTLTLRPAMLAFTAVLALGTGLIFGLYPALHSTRTDLATVLRSNAGQPAGAGDASRFRSSLVIAQLALSTALLMVAGLFIKSLLNVSQVDLGLRADNIVAFGISPELNGYEPEESKALFQRVEQELAAMPGVTGVTGAMGAILSGNNWGNDVSVEGFEWGPDVDNNARMNRIGPAYFSTLGIPLMAGREFTADDALEAPGVALVNEAFVEKFGLEGARAVGKRMAVGSGPDTELDLEIVGVVQNAKYSEVKQVVPPLFFTPYRQDESIGELTFYVRSSGSPEQTLRAIPAVVERLDPNLPVEHMITLEQQAADSVFLDRFLGTLSSAFALLATLLASVGLYGVLAYTVAQRTREFGIRMALGADGGRVRSMVLRQLGRMALIGCGVGLAVALALGRAAESLLFELQGNDPLVVVTSIILLGLVALVAGYVPALRASRIDPMRALRYE